MNVWPNGVIARHPNPTRHDDSFLINLKSDLMWIVWPFFCVRGQGGIVPCHLVMHMPRLPTQIIHWFARPATYKLSVSFLPSALCRITTRFLMLSKSFHFQTSTPIHWFSFATHLYAWVGHAVLRSQSRPLVYSLTFTVCLCSQSRCRSTNEGCFPSISFRIEMYVTFKSAFGTSDGIFSS